MRTHYAHAQGHPRFSTWARNVNAAAYPRWRHHMFLQHPRCATYRDELVAGTREDFLDRSAQRAPLPTTTIFARIVKQDNR